MFVRRGLLLACVATVCVAGSFVEASQHQNGHHQVDTTKNQHQRHEKNIIM
jgi:hypothetical protein